MYGNNTEPREEVKQQKAEQASAKPGSPTSFPPQLYQLLLQILLNAQDDNALQIILNETKKEKRGQETTGKVTFDQEVEASLGEDFLKYVIEQILNPYRQQQDPLQPQSQADQPFALPQVTGSFLRKTNIRIESESSLEFKFCGFPGANLPPNASFDMLRQVCIVLNLWNQKQKFPIGYEHMYMGEQVKDETFNVINGISQQLTPVVRDLFKLLPSNDAPHTRRVAKLLLIGLGSKGIQVMLGFRKTVGTQDLKWPSAAALLQAFNKPNQVLRDEERQRLKSVSKLTVGARALLKHCHRSSDGFWGQPTGTELQKNEMANKAAQKILRECVWMNIHKMLQSEVIVECRVIQGYGIRWSGDGTFRGFLEPQMEGGHDQKWRH